MTSLIGSYKKEFQQQLSDLFSKIPDKGAFHKMRCKSWDHFLQLGLPSKQMEVYRYINLRKLYSQTFLPLEKAPFLEKGDAEKILRDVKPPFLTFVNGHFMPEASLLKSLPRNFVISTLQEAAKTYGAFLNNNLSM